jgi:hypothetical protein
LKAGGGQVFMGISKHENLCDSKAAYKIKKREAKSNQKIAESIDRIKKLYRNLSFYESFVPDENQVKNDPRQKLAQIQ